MNTTKKITKKDRFNALLNLAEVKANPDLVDFINHEIELLAKKNSSEKKPTATQLANDGIKAAILETMEEGRLYSITELQKLVPNLPESMSNQRMTALVRQLKDADLVERVEEKGRAKFKLAD